MIMMALLIGVVLVLLVVYVFYRPPKFMVDFVQWLNPDVVFHVPLPSSSRVAALTLDDAPSDETAEMLDMLKTYGAKATFFIIGCQVAGHADLLQRMHDEGHEVGNHAWADERSLKLPLSELERQIKEVEALLPPNSNSLKYFRPGQGFWSKKMVEKVKSLGYKMILGSMIPYDPANHNPKSNAGHVLSMVRPGAVLILHDRRSYSAEQLELTLRGLAAEEWEVESVGGLLRVAEEEKKSGIKGA